MDPLEAGTFVLPGRARLRWAGDLSLDAAGVLILGWGLTHGAWQVAASGGGHLMNGRPLAETFNAGVRSGLSYLVPLLTIALVVKAVRNFKPEPLAPERTSA